MGLMHYTYTYTYSLSSKSHATGNGTYSLGNWTQTIFAKALFPLGKGIMRKIMGLIGYR